jgi:thymidine kinase
MSQIVSPSPLIELIQGPMFSGKSTALLARLEELERAGNRILAFKPRRDARYAPDSIVTHDGAARAAANIDDMPPAPHQLLGIHAIGVDEAHFFESGLADHSVALAAAGIRVVLAGVDLDHRGQPFPVMARLRLVAGIVVDRRAQCSRCGESAQFTQRLILGNDRIIVGGREAYEPRCASCFEAPP